MKFAKQYTHNVTKKRIAMFLLSLFLRSFPHNNFQHVISVTFGKSTQHAQTQTHTNRNRHTDRKERQIRREMPSHIFACYKCEKHTHAHQKIRKFLAQFQICAGGIPEQSHAHFLNTHPYPHGLRVAMITFILQAYKLRAVYLGVGFWLFQVISVASTRIGSAKLCCQMACRKEDQKEYAG